MNEMKNLSIKNQIKTLTRSGALVLSLFFAQACQDALQENVISQIGSEYLNTPKGLDDAVSAAYSSMRSWYGTERGHNLTEFGTDIYTNGADGSWKFMNTYTNQFDSQNGQVRELWDDFYRGINTCNAVIERAADIAGVSEAVKTQRIAEAKFIRAHHYFILVQLFGPVELRLEETKVPTKEVKRNTEAEIYAAIIQDLTDAIPGLEAKKAATQYGRATKAAAEHLLGKVYVTKGTSSAKAADDFAKAETLFKNVITNYGLKLLPDFGLVHAFGNEINDEVIWSVQYTRVQLTNGGGNNSHVFYLMEYDTQPGMRRDTENGRPFKRYRPTVYAMETVYQNRENDSRYKKSFKDTYRSNRPGTFNASFDNSKTTLTFAQGDTTMYLPGVEVPLAERAKKKYQVLIPSRYDERIFLAINKHFDGGRIDRTQFEGGRDFIAFRLADTYLMLAEAQFFSGATADAATTYNVVRRRAAWPGKESAMLITASDLNVNFVMDERERELLGEQSRWFDLARWGNLVERVKLHNPQAAPYIKAHHVLRPIPQLQIDRAEGTSSGFPQNPGY